jgi:hypothetical protein
MHNRPSVSKGTILAADLEELITRGPRRSMRSLAQEMSIFLNAVNTMVSEDLKGLSHEIDFKNFDKNLQNLT